jgi:hypothetical protein
MVAPQLFIKRAGNGDGKEHGAPFTRHGRMASRSRHPAPRCGHAFDSPTGSYCDYCRSQVQAECGYGHSECLGYRQQSEVTESSRCRPAPVIRVMPAVDPGKSATKGAFASYSPSHLYRVCRVAPKSSTSYVSPLDLGYSAPSWHAALEDGIEAIASGPAALVKCQQREEHHHSIKGLRKVISSR